MKWYYWVGIVVAVILGISTLIPAPASKPSLLGYYAHCSFTPISTIICLVIAGVIYWLGKGKKNRINDGKASNSQSLLFFQFKLEMAFRSFIILGRQLH